jgi:hypothetical protein
MFIFLYLETALANDAWRFCNLLNLIITNLVTENLDTKNLAAPYLVAQNAQFKAVDSKRGRPMAFLFAF